MISNFKIKNTAERTRSDRVSRRRLSGGFTLLETMIAVLILMGAIAGPLTIVQKAIQSTTLAKNQDTAFFLAQEAVEYVRFVRDTNKLKGYPWLEGLDGTNPNSVWAVDGLNGDCVSATGAQNCMINALQPSGQNAITSCGAGGAACTPINYDATNNYFSYTTGTLSIFTRTVSIQTPVGVNDCTPDHGCEAILTVVVSWCDQASVCSVTPRKVILREDIFDWQ